MTAEVIGIWVAALLTLCIMSFLYKDNPFYKLAEHIFIGVSAGYWFAQLYKATLVPGVWRKLFWKSTVELSGTGFSAYLVYFLEKFGPTVAAILGILMLMRLFPKVSWISRWPLAFAVGTTAGITIYSFASGQVLAQVKATMIPLFISGDWAQTANNWFIIIGVCCGLIYFYFSKPHKGIMGGASKVGIWFLMISFGATFGYTVMARISLISGRFIFLLKDWLQIIK